MTEPGRSAGSEGGGRRKRFLSPLQKYEIWLALVRGELTTVEAADRAGVDRSTIVKLRAVAKQGALDALAVSRPGVKAVWIRSSPRRARRSPGSRRRSRRWACG
jgi:hypothetical protein